MMRYWSIVLASVMVFFAAGCQTSGPGIHMVPVTRDYAQLEKVSFEGASDSVRAAHDAGAATAAPYEYFSALQYLAIARDLARQGDRQGARDYAGLAKSMSDAAVRVCPADSDRAEPRAPASSHEECQAQFERVKARYGELDKEKAIEVAPVVYAHLTAMVSRAEHALKTPATWRGSTWRGADTMLRVAESDIDSVLAQDIDEDGIADMNDAAPRVAEDFDAFEDEDGAPDMDNDRDGVPDRVDVAPNDPETVNGFKDHDGAPDQLPRLDAVLFSGGSAELTGEAQGYLRGVKELLAEWPRLRLRVSGHGNQTEVESTDMDLSRARAEKVRACLAEQGVPAHQLVVTFLGGTQPRADTRTAAGRAQNARVELLLE